MPKATSSKGTKTASSKGLLQLGPFTVLPLVLTPSSSKHYLYLRPDAVASSSSDGQAQEQRTLFVANLPVDADEDKLRSIFGEVGAIEDIRFGGAASAKGKEVVQDDDFDESSEEESADDEDEEEEESGSLEMPNTRPRPPKASKPSKAKKPIVVTPLFDLPPNSLKPAGTTAQITFLSPLSLIRSLSLSSRPWPTPSSTNAGLARYLLKHATLRPDLATVKAHADSSIAAFERLQAEEKKRVQTPSEMVDEDGFTLVVRGGKYGKDAGGGGVGVASKRWELEQAAEGTEKKKKKSKELKDFYRCVSLT